MSSEARWLRAVDVCERVWNGRLDADRNRLLAACDGDVETRELVNQILGADGKADGFLESPPLLIPETPVPEREDELPTGAKIGRYEIKLRIAEGGMGEVYEARQDRPSRPVALKLLPTHYARRGAARRFEREAEVLGRLRHPNIAHIFEAGTARLQDEELERPFLAMELIDGEPIDDFVERRGISIEDRIQLFIQICDAIQHAHQRGIIHRDIKPSNVLVTEVDGVGVPKVIDFGIAHLDDEDWTQTVTDSSRERLVGSIPYMSPEQVAGGTCDVDVRSDVYSLGVLIYQLLTGHLPYESEMVFELIRAIGAGEIVQLRRRDLNIPRDLQAIVLHALEKRPDDRYQSVAELKLDLRRFLDGDPVPVAHGNTLYRALKIAKRHKAASLAASSILAAISLGVIGTSWQAIRATQSEARALDRMQDLRTLTNSLIFELHDSIYRIQGATDAKRLLVQRGVEYLDQLAQEDTNDPELMRQLAEGYHRLAMVLGHSNSPNLGDTESALDRFTSAIHWRRLLAADGDFDAMRELAIGLMWRGFLYADSHRIEGASADFDESCMILQRLCEENPGLWEPRMLLAECAQGAVLRFGDQDEPYLRDLFAQRWTEYLLGEPAPPVSSARDSYCRAETDFCLGVMLEPLGQIPGALAAFDRASSGFEQWVDLEPTDHVRHMTLTNTSRYRGNLLSRIGRYEESIHEFQRAEIGFRRIVQMNPEDIRGPQMLATVLAERAGAHLEIDQVDRALLAAEEAVSVAESLARSDADNMGMGALITQCHFWYGRSLLAAAEQLSRPVYERRNLAGSARAQFSIVIEVSNRESYPSWKTSRKLAVEWSDRCEALMERMGR